MHAGQGRRGPGVPEEVQRYPPLPHDSGRCLPPIHNITCVILFLVRFLWCFSCVQKKFFYCSGVVSYGVLLFFFIVYIYIEFILSGIVTITASWSFLWRSFVFIGWVFFV